MSGGAPEVGRARWVAFARRLAALGVLLGLVLGGRVISSHPTPTGPLLALGMLLIGGVLAAELLEHLGLPHLTGYLLAGLLLGPHVLGAVPEQTVADLGLVNTLALALIALSAGGELSVQLLREGARTIGSSITSQLLVVLPLMMATFFLLRSRLEFVSGLGTWGVWSVAGLWGVLALSRSPSATLGVISQLRPQGPLTRYALGVVISFDIVVLVLFTFALAAAGALAVPGGDFSMAELRDVGRGMVGALACGTTLGLVIALYLHITTRRLILFLVAVAYGATEFTRYFHFESLLLFMCAGFVVANVTNQGERLLEAVAAGGSVVYVIFFALAGAHLDLGQLARLWPVALGLGGARVLSTYVATRVSARWAGDPPLLKRLAWMPLVSQAGVTIGMAVIVAERFPGFGESFRSLAIAVVGLNEGVGPVLFKWALDRAGETGKRDQGEVGAGVPLAGASAPSLLP